MKESDAYLKAADSRQSPLYKPGNIKQYRKDIRRNIGLPFTNTKKTNTSIKSETYEEYFKVIWLDFSEKRLSFVPLFFLC